MPPRDPHVRIFKTYNSSDHSMSFLSILTTVWKARFKLKILRLLRISHHGNEGEPAIGPHPLLCPTPQVACVWTPQTLHRGFKHNSRKKSFLGHPPGMGCPRWLPTAIGRTPQRTVDHTGPGNSLELSRLCTWARFTGQMLLVQGGLYHLYQGRVRGRPKRSLESSGLKSGGLFTQI